MLSLAKELLVLWAFLTSLLGLTVWVMTARFPATIPSSDYTTMVLISTWDMTLRSINLQMNGKPSPTCINFLDLFR